MGADVMIYFQSENITPNLSWDALIGATYKKINPTSWAPGATHQVFLSGNDRFYGKGYERGVAPVIVGVLMDLFASTDISKVWYGSDYDTDPLMEFTKENVCELAMHYMNVGNRPYRGK